MGGRSAFSVVQTKGFAKLLAEFAQNASWACMVRANSARLKIRRIEQPLVVLREELNDNRRLAQIFFCFETIDIFIRNNLRRGPIYSSSRPLVYPFEKLAHPNNETRQNSILELVVPFVKMAASENNNLFRGPG